MRKLNRRHLILLVLLLGIGVTSLALLSAQRQEPFGLELDKLVVNPSDRPGYDTEVVLHLRGRGPWQEKVPYLTTVPKGKAPQYGIASGCDIFYRQNGQMKQYQWPQGKSQTMEQVGPYDTKYGGFIRHYAINLAAIPPELGPLYCRVQFKFFIDTTKSWRHKDWATKADAEASGFVQVRA